MKKLICIGLFAVITFLSGCCSSCGSRQTSNDDGTTTTSCNNGTCKIKRVNE